MDTAIKDIAADLSGQGISMHVTRESYKQRHPMEILQDLMKSELDCTFNLKDAQHLAYIMVTLELFGVKLGDGGLKDGAIAIAIPKGQHSNLIRKAVYVFGRKLENVSTLDEFDAFFEPLIKKVQELHLIQEVVHTPQKSDTSVSHKSKKLTPEQERMLSNIRMKKK